MNLVQTKLSNFQASCYAGTDAHYSNADKWTFTFNPIPVVRANMADQEHAYEHEH